MSRHISSGGINVHIYHGTGTFVERRVLEQSDVVLTTYETASFDYIKRKALNGVSWFRVVLDEGI